MFLALDRKELLQQLQVARSRLVTASEKNAERLRKTDPPYPALDQSASNELPRWKSNNLWLLL